jgi:PAS domain-containing protein
MATCAVGKPEASAEDVVLQLLVDQHARLYEGDFHEAKRGIEPRRTALVALHRVLDQAPTGLGFFDQGGGLIFWNKAYADVLASFGAQARLGGESSGPWRGRRRWWQNCAAM